MQGRHAVETNEGRDAERMLKGFQHNLAKDESRGFRKHVHANISLPQAFHNFLRFSSYVAINRTRAVLKERGVFIIFITG